MKRNVIAKRMATAVLTGAMVMSMGMNAFAAVAGVDEQGDAQRVQIKKTVTTDGKTFAPNAVFSFIIESGEASNATEEAPAIQKGIDTENITIGKVTFTSDSDLKYLNSEYSGFADIDVSKVTYKTPGIYHYVISENIPENEIEGITYDDSKKDIYVYVENDNGENVVKAVVSSTNDGGKAATIEFINNYGRESDKPEDPDDKVFDATVYKKVTGNQGDREKAFSFVLGIKSIDPDKYFVVDIPGDTIVVRANESTRISLADGQFFTINGLTESDTYTVEEQDYSLEGYHTFVEKNEYTEETYDEDGKTSNNVIDENNKVDNANGVKYTVINNNNVTTPTGIILSFAPYILMVAAAGIFAVLFLRRKREEF